MLAALQSLTERDIAVVQGDWQKVERIADVAATLLYDRLFELDPELRLLFKTDMTEQKAKLLRMIGAAIYGLSDPELLAPILQYLGRKHVGFGVALHDYSTVGEALLWTLRRGLGADFGPESEVAWGKVYGVFADAMTREPPPVS